MAPATVKAFPYRKVLPAVQLAICLVVMWLVRAQVLFGISQILLSHAPAGRQTNQHIVIELPALTPEQERQLGAKQRRDDYYMNVLVVLDFPNIILQVPYVIVARREWAPAGIFVEGWRVLGWPFVGLVFWWAAGRGFEALQAAGRGVIHPQVSWIEAVSAVVFTLLGGTALVGLLTTTPDDRADLHFMALLAGALLWGGLGMVVLAARFQQWRIEKRTLGTGAPPSFT